VSLSNHRVHRWAGIALLTPLFAWCLTGLVFLIQPGYGAAYEALPVRSYPLTEPLNITPQEDWLEYKVLRTVLGSHLLVRGNTGWRHLNATTLTPFPADAQQRHNLISDAIALKADRYGHLLETHADPYLTSTGAEIRLQWNTLSLQQNGLDTRWIDRMYRVHYLQWTGIKALDKVLGVFGLLLLILISVTGARLLLRSNSTKTPLNV
jgi:hypothetical protein